MKQLLATLAFSATTAAATPVKIMPIGDSITEFVKDAERCPQGYRYELWKELVDTGLSFELVGSHSYTDEYGTQYPRYKGLAFQDHANGWGGWKSGDFLYGKRGGWGSGRGTVESWLTEVTPDIVLLHVGTNDSWASRPLGEVEANIRGILDVVTRKAPQATTYLAKIIPMGAKSGGGGMVASYNSRIDAIAASYPRVKVVDQYAGYDADTDNACDEAYHVHPGPSGARKMASKWRDAILDEVKRGQ